MNYPCQPLPHYLDDFYLIKLAYHVFESINVLLFHRGRHDFSEFLLHHIVTITLVGFSYVTNFIPIGAVIMLVMDTTDIFVAFFKLTVDFNDILERPGFLSMFFSWIYLRLYIFPFYQIT